MIICYHAGRLGNQLFQYTALHRLAPRRPLLLFGFAELHSGFDGLSYGAPPLVIDTLTALVRRLGRKRIERFVRRGWLGRLEHTRNPEYRPIVSRGTLGTAVLVTDAYFQHQSAVDSPAAAQLQIKPQFLSAARTQLATHTDDPEHAYFVHVRLGDYRSFPSPEHAAALPAAWYRAQIAALRERDPQAQIIAMSDEPAAAREYLAGLPAVSFSTADQMTDLALMTLCRGGGVLSASSFAWWGAALLRRTAPQARLIAPLHWIGHAQSRWIPATVETDWLEYAPVR